MWKHNNFINLQLHAPSLNVSFNLVIGAGVEKIVWENPDMGAAHEATSSGTYNTYTRSETTFELTLKSGASVENISILTYAGTTVTPVLTGNTFSYTVPNGTGEPAFTLTIKTNKDVVTTVDLTTLTGWSSLSDGEHTITIKAKADGYRDSQASEGVQVTKGSTGETWVLNETPSWTSAKSFSDISFVSNGTTYSGIRTSYDSTPMGAERTMLYGNGTYITVYDGVTGGEGWKNTAYRTITFQTAPTGDLLTWLQANGTKQGGGERPGKV